LPTEDRRDIYITGYEAFNNRDFTGAVRTFDPEVEWDFSEMPDGKIVRGVEELRAYWSTLVDTWDEFRIEVDDFIDGPDADVTLIRLIAKARTSGLRFDDEAALVWESGDGRVKRVRFYMNRRAALDAAGIPA
jgi:ketosteroid isomerase-like protein